MINKGLATVNPVDSSTTPGAITDGNKGTTDTTKVIKTTVKQLTIPSDAELDAVLGKL